MKTLKEMQVAEAIKRLEMLEKAGKCKGALSAFKNGSVKVFTNEDLIIAPKPDVIKDVISELENLFGILVYVSFRSDDVDMLSEVFCYVSPYPEEWDEERELLLHDQFLAFYLNWMTLDMAFGMFPPPPDHEEADMTYEQNHAG